ncbi:MAG: hypothetical protein AAF086_07730 [Planctomycetota bacterium]
MRPLIRTVLVFCIVLTATAWPSEAFASIVTLNTAFLGVASVDEPSTETGPTEIEGRLGLTLASADPSTTQVFSPPGFDAEQTVITYVFSASPSGFSGRGNITASDNRSGGVTFGTMQSVVNFTVDEAALYEMVFKDNSDSVSSARTRLDASDRSVAVFDLSSEPDTSTFNRQLSLTPGVDYTFTTTAAARGGGDGGTDSGEGVADYTLTLQIVPEPASGVVFAALAWVCTCRRVRRG